MKLTIEQHYRDTTARQLGGNIGYIQTISGQCVRVVLSGTGSESRKIEREYAEKELADANTAQSTTQA